MDSYVTRIYRRDRKNPRGIVGVVEQVGVKGRKVFRDSEELVDILTALKGRASSPKKRNKGKKSSHTDRKGTRR